MQTIVALAPETPGRHGEVLLRLQEDDGSLILPGVFMLSAGQLKPWRRGLIGLNLP